jgi:regulatory factor X
VSELDLQHYSCMTDPLGLIDCGIRPATAAEAEWLQDYIQKSNNNATQTSVNAARHAEGSNRAEDRSDDDDEDGSEGASSLPGSNRNSLLLGDVKTLSFDDLSDKTPTAATLLSQAQSVTRPIGTFPPTASIRRFPAQETNLGLPATSSPNVGSAAFATPQPTSSVRQFPNFPSIEDAVANSTSSHGMVAREVWSWFQDHLDALLESIRTFRVDQFEMHLRTFWTSLNGVHREIVHAPAIAGIMAKADAMVYDVCTFYFFFFRELLLKCFFFFV